MNKVVNFLHKYLVMISLLIGISILLGLSYSSFFFSSDNHKAAEMYIGELKYSMTIDNESKNTLTVPPGETIIDLTVNSLDPVDTYYKLLYLKNSNIEIKYYESTKDTDEIVTTYSKPNDSIVANNSNNIKLLIINNSETDQTIELVLKGGYITNTLSDISLPTNYSEITVAENTENTYFCKTTDTLTEGLKYVNKQYTYSYKQSGINSNSELAWNSMNNGWGVQLTDKTSTDAITSKVCTYINNIPITSMAYMFYNSKATVLDVSKLDTHNIVNMAGMFRASEATEINVSSFNTSKVTDMSEMFYYSKTTVTDVSKFDTSKVTNMSGMFYYSKATVLDISKFDTKNVTDMSYMFSASMATTLDVSNFNTSKVTNMGYMFTWSNSNILDVSSFDTSNVTNMESMFMSASVTTLDVNNFNTSKVTSMYSMFENSEITNINLSSFDTSKVTNMGLMFRKSKSITIDLSSFDTSNVTNMSAMFWGSESLKTIYASDNFVVTNVEDDTNMFWRCYSLIGGAGSAYDSTKKSKLYAHIDGGTADPGYFTEKIFEPNSFATDSWKTIIKAVKENNTSKYNLGDTKTINMGTYGTHTVRIANTTTPSECSTTGFSQTACGFVLEFADIITNHIMNPSGTHNGKTYSLGWNEGGWPETQMRTFINNDIYNSFPTELQKGIISTTVLSSHGVNDANNFTSTDKLYLLSGKEIYAGFSDDLETIGNLTRQLDYYKKIGVTVSDYSSAIKKNGETISIWWLRSADSTYGFDFTAVNTQGIWLSSQAAYSSSGVSPAFRIG